MLRNTSTCDGEATAKENLLRLIWLIFASGWETFGVFAHNCRLKRPTAKEMNDEQCEVSGSELFKTICDDKYSK